MKESFQYWVKDFDVFLNTTPVTPPLALSSRVLLQIQNKLNPAFSLVLTKLFLLHLVAGSMTLVFCPQFGIGFSNNAFNVMHFLTKFGEHVCMFGCGVFFVSLSALLAALSLKPEELRVLKRFPGLPFLITALVSTGLLLCFGAEITFGSIFLIWLLGVVTGGTTTLEIGWALRKSLFE
ncbi:MAG: hypothetical protein HY843_00740 [Bdellovibrio sp.]|nr:hypothetical protein [Bdellovibrio sp.]